MRIARLKYFSEDENKKNYTPAIIGGTVTGLGVGGGMAGIEKVDRKEGITKKLKPLLGIKGDNETVIEKLKRKGLDIIGGPKVEEENGLGGFLKNKIKRKLANKDLSTFRGSDEFIDPLKETINKYKGESKKAEQGAKKIEEQIKKRPALETTLGDHAKHLREQSVNILEDPVYKQTEEELQRLKKLRKKGNIARGYVESMDWMRNNWNNGKLGKAKVASIPLGAGTVVGLGIGKITNRKKKEE